MRQKLIIIRGLPGSGKSTLAKEYAEQGFSHYEADMFFINNDGEYVFDAGKLKKAHEWCYDNVSNDLFFGESVVVSNTFVKKWEFKRYIEFAKKFNIEVEILTCSGNYGSIHDVPIETIDKMKNNWEEYYG